MKFKDLFWWLEVPYKVVWAPFWSLLLSVIVLLIPGLNIWWWLIIPLFLANQAEMYYRWWIAWDFWVPKKKWIVLEVVPPKESLAPFKAMEDVFSVIWTLIDVANWREIWCEGELPMGPEWFSCELASVEGDIHFYIRCLDVHRHIFESAIYSHYPETEITQVPDYTRNVPQNIPNEEWNIYGSEFVFAKPSAYPIKTHSRFFEPGGEKISQEEKRIDPIISFLEGLARLGPGEQFWYQILAVPIVDSDIDWKGEAKKIINKIAKRPEKKEEGLMDELGKSWNEFMAGVTSATAEEFEEKKEMALSPAKTESGEKEMLLTPGEREVLQDIEDKIKKNAFNVTIRGVYVAKRKNWTSPHRKIGESYMPHFAAQNLNFFLFHGKTRTKVHFLMRKKRTLLRQKKMFYNFVMRYPPMFPDWAGRGTNIMNTEELATIYHFPTKISALVAPKVVRVEAKKGGPPPNLPVEEK